MEVMTTPNTEGQGRMGSETRWPQVGDKMKFLGKNGYDDRDDGGHGQRHIVHGHHQFENGPIFKKNRTDLDTYAWYTGRLVIGVFNHAYPVITHDH